MKTCLVVANGPSLAEVPNSFLEKYTTFASNRIFLKEDFQPTYLTVVDPIQMRTPFLIKPIAACARGCKRWFISSDIYRLLAMFGLALTAPNISYLNWQNLKDDEGNVVVAFSDDPTQLVISGGTVTYVNMQLAFYMGFRRILLVGLDHDFLSSRGSHFHPDYNPGIQYKERSSSWNAEGSIFDDEIEFSQEGYCRKTEYFYRYAAAYFAEHGGEIINLTPKTALNTYPIMSVEEYEDSTDSGERAESR